MKINIDWKVNPNLELYRRVDINLAYSFTKDCMKEFGKMLKAVVLFGSSARKTKTPESDLDILIVVDDLSMNFTEELTEAYRLVVQKLIAKHSTRIHVTTLRFSSMWEYIRNGDPIAINILRDGIPILDTGFFEPLQVLLKRGRIRPSDESIWTYYIRAPNTLHNSKWHLLQATIDLYWAVIDAAHAALMRHGEIPPSPEHVADLLHDKLVKNKLLEERYVHIMRNFFHLAKMITHRELREVKGEEFDRYYKEAEEFVDRMKKYIGWK
ncbi:nucleotidyltransferase domain-containing protein [Candidatus Woesearchaeota archaeon]|nr:nucleotidyltransferase domain-containing protein [Candidatus Woesearchaeota archaeon]